MWIDKGAKCIPQWAMLVDLSSIPESVCNIRARLQPEIWALTSLFANGQAWLLSLLILKTDVCKGVKVHVA